MPQLSHKTEAINWDVYLVEVLSPTERLALERVGFSKRVGFTKRKWHELDWFVRFAKADLDKASQGDLLSLQEEIVAMLTVHFRNRPESTPTLEQIIEIQRTVRNHLTDLADRGKTCLPPPPGRLWIRYPRILAQLSLGATAGAKMEQLSRMPDIVSLRAASGDPANLVSVMGELLEKAGKPIVRCPHCRTIFLQSRRNQEYCSRSCQSVAVMKKRRAETKAKIKRKRTARTPGPKTSARGGSRHGKKRR